MRTATGAIGGTRDLGPVEGIKMSLDVSQAPPLSPDPLSPLCHHSSTLPHPMNKIRMDLVNHYFVCFSLFSYIERNSKWIISFSEWIIRRIAVLINLSDTKSADSMFENMLLYLARDSLYDTVFSLANSKCLVTCSFLISAAILWRWTILCFDVFLAAGRVSGSSFSRLFFYNG